MGKSPHLSCDEKKVKREEKKEKEKREHIARAQKTKKRRETQSFKKIKAGKKVGATRGLNPGPLARMLRIEP